MIPSQRSLPRWLFFGVALVHWCLPVKAEERPLFQENFAGKLSGGWTWIDEQPGTWRLIDDSLELKVVQVGDGLWAGGRTHPNLLLCDPATKGDFAVEVFLESNPTGHYEHAGVLLYGDGDNFVALNKEMLEKPEIALVAETAAKPVTRQTPYEHEAVYLRLVVTGKKVTGQYRHYDSDAWASVGELDLPPAGGPYKVGVYAGRPPKDADHRVRFSQFRIVPVSRAATTEAETANQQPKKATGLSAPASAPASRSVRTDIPLEVQARQAAERAIPFIEESGTGWITERNCLACHYVGYMLWSLREASQRGFAIDAGALAESLSWALAQPTKNDGLEGAAQILIARDRSDRSKKTSQQLETLRDAIIQGQDHGGSWKPGGQLPDQKRPLSETTQVSTMLCVLGLDSLDPPNGKAIEARNKALAWLDKTPPNGTDPAVSSEWYAARLLIAKRFGDPKQIEVLRDRILSAQQPDGGWGWLRADKSDAFGTGISIYALCEVGAPHSHPAIRKAWRFLIETQTDEGSWVVNGTKKSTKDKPHPFTGFWGSTWALLGLSHSLPSGTSNGTPQSVGGS
jgi:regulation of enolase protein 1 (concanavalin A-like superfamily)